MGCRIAPRGNGGKYFVMQSVATGPYPDCRSPCLRLARRIARREALFRALVDAFLVARRPVRLPLLGLAGPSVGVPAVSRRLLAFDVSVGTTGVASTLPRVGVIH